MSAQMAVSAASERHGILPGTALGNGCVSPRKRMNPSAKIISTSTAHEQPQAMPSAEFTKFSSGACRIPPMLARIFRLTTGLHMPPQKTTEITSEDAATSTQPSARR